MAIGAGSVVESMQILEKRAVSAFAFTIFAVALCAAGPANATCPAGSQFFAYGGAGGCVKPGSNEVVLKCFSMGKVCPSGWSNEGATDTGSWCCPPAAAPPRGDAQAPVQNETCMWRGTAPFCKGGCKPGESTRGATDDSDSAFARAHPDFGADCISGVKAYCCRPTFPKQ
jgi:hypothetical protein